METFEKATVNNFNEITNKIVTTVQETEDAFIFQTLNNFTLNTSGITVNKEELIRAIQLIRMMKETGMDIHDCYASAAQQKEMYRNAYERGLQDGAKREHDRIMDILDTCFKESPKK